MNAPHEPLNQAAALRVPPHSIEAEQSLLGGLLLDNKAYANVCDLVSGADFYRHEHRIVFEEVAAMLGEHQPVDVITLFERLQGQGRIEQAGGLSYLNALQQSVPSASNIVRYAEIVRERSMRRRLIAVSDEIASRAFNPHGAPVVELLDDAKLEIGQLVDRQGSGGGRRIPLLSMEQLRDTSAAVRWVIKHVVPAESIGMLFGASGTFKSFIALDCALHVAHGLPWMGRRTKQGPVIYIAAEGGAGLWSRILAWHKARHLRWQDVPFKIVPVALDLTADAWRVVEAAQIVGVHPSMVVVDTLSQTYAGEENSANEMAAYFRELGTRFRQLWQCAVMLIHHSGHNATERPRGSSTIRGNVDFLLGAFRDEKEMLATLTCVKQKDGDCFDDATFSLSTHDLGTDEDGDAVTALVARHLSSDEEIEQAAAAEARAGRGGHHTLFLRLAQNGIKESELRKIFMDECGIENQDTRRKYYLRARGHAIKKGYIEIAQGIVITLKKGGTQ